MFITIVVCVCDTFCALRLLSAVYLSPNSAFFSEHNNTGVIKMYRYIDSANATLTGSTKCDQSIAFEQLI